MNLNAFYSEAYPDRPHHYTAPVGRFTLTADFNAALHGRTIAHVQFESWTGAEFAVLSNPLIVGSTVKVTVQPGSSAVSHIGPILCQVTLSDGSVLGIEFIHRPTDRRLWAHQSVSA